MSASAFISDRADARARKRARAGRRGIARACARAAQKAKKQQKRCSGSRAVAKCSSSLWGVTLNAAAKLAQVMAPSREPMRDRVGSARRAEHIPSSARARTRWERSEPARHGRRSRASLAAPKVPSLPPSSSGAYVSGWPSCTRQAVLSEEKQQAEVLCVALRCQSRRSGRSRRAARVARLSASRSACLRRRARARRRCALRAARGTREHLALLATFFVNPP